MYKAIKVSTDRKLENTTTMRWGKIVYPKSKSKYIGHNAMHVRAYFGEIYISKLLLGC